MNDNKLKELCRFIASLKINKGWTEDVLFNILRDNPKLIKGWVTIRRDIEKISKEKVTFT